MTITSLSPIEVVQLAAQPALVVRTECARAELGARLATVLPRVFQFAIANGHAAAGPPFTRYLLATEDRVSIEAGLTLAAAAPGEGDIVATELPAGRAAMLIHSGAYEGLPKAHAALARWAEDNRVKVGGAAWEVYVTDPASQPDPAQWKTKVLLPLAD